MKDAKLDWPWLFSRFTAISLPLLVIIYFLMWAYWIATGAGLLDRAGNPIGGDYSLFWTAASLARQGDAAAVYDFHRLRAAELAVFGKEIAFPFPYPPTFLLLLLPLGMLPYLPSLALWLTVTGGGYLWLIRRIAPHPRIIWLALAFPGTFQNLGFGQNGWLSTLFLGGGLLLLDRSPLVAGALFGLLTYKPHLAALIPVALVAARRWRALLAMGLSTAAFILISVLVLGGEAWVSFLNNMQVALKDLERCNFALIHKMPSVFPAMILAGAGITTARVLQGAAMLVAAAAVAWIWRRGAAPPLRNAVLVLGILLFVPYGFIYDLALLALPLAWLGWEGYQRGWLPGEKTILLLGFFTPLVAPGVAQATHVQPAPLILGALLFLAWRRAALESPSTPLERVTTEPGDTSPGLSSNPLRAKEGS
ncbi:MAG: glycosyltransferase family 87 protein [Thermodesulfobacteriota bacterium]